MSCDCNALSNQLNQINGKIDNLIRENNQLKTELNKKADTSQVKGVIDATLTATGLLALPSQFKGLALGVSNLGGTVASLNSAFANTTGSITAQLASQLAQQKALGQQVSGLKGNINRVTSNINSAKALAQNAQNSANRVQSVLNGKLDKVIKSNRYLANLVSGVQSGLSRLGVLMNKLAPLLSIVGLLVSIAALAVSIGSIRVLGNRIDVLENGLELQGNSISKILGNLVGIRAKVDRLANISPSLQADFDRLSATVRDLNKDVNLQLSNLRLADKAFMTKSAVQALVNTTIATATSVIVGSAVGAVINRFPRITRIPISGTNTVTNNTRIIERQTINNTIIQPTVRTNTYREIRTNTVNNNNTVREVNRSSNQNVDYARIQGIVSNDGSITRGLLGGIRQNVTATRTRLNNVAPPILRSDISQAVQQATRPLVDGVADIRKKTASLYQNQFIQSAMSTLNTAILVHNAMRLSFDAGQFITDSLGAVLNLTGIKFRDENQNEVSLSQAVGNRLDNAIDSIIPIAWQNRLNDLWIRSSSIFSSAANVLWAVRNIGDELQNVTEITNDRLGLWMNTARNEGLVSGDAYPHQPPISTGSVYGRYNTFLAKVNRKTESFENTVSRVEDVAGSVGYIATVPMTVNEELTQIKENRERIVEAVEPSQVQREEAENEQLLDNEAPETLISPVPYIDDEP